MTKPIKSFGPGLMVIINIFIFQEHRFNRPHLKAKEAVAKEL